MTSTKSSKLASKKFLMSAAIAVAAVILVTATISSGVLAQGVNTTSRNATTSATITSPNQANNLPNGSHLPNITGSIPLTTISEDFILKS